MKKSKEKKKLPTIVCSLDAELHESVEELRKKTGATKTEITRRALRSYVDTGDDDGRIVLNLTMLVEILKENKDSIPKKVYTELQHYTENIVKIKGGR